MTTMLALPGERIDRAIARMLGEANYTGRWVEGEFNGILFIVHPGANAATIESDWYETFEHHQHAAKLKRDQAAALQAKIDGIDYAIGCLTADRDRLRKELRA